MRFDLYNFAAKNPNRYPAFWTSPNIPRKGLKDALLIIIVTAGTKPVIRLAGVLAGFERIYKRTSESPQRGTNLFKLVTRPFLIPIFLFNELLFQVVARAQNILIVRLNHIHFGLKVEDDASKLYRNLVDFDFLACVRKSLRCAGYRFKKSKNCGKFGCHNAEINPQIPRQVNQ